MYYHNEFQNNYSMFFTLESPLSPRKVPRTTVNGLNRVKNERVIGRYMDR